MILALWHRWAQTHQHALLIALVAFIALDLALAHFVVVPLMREYVEWVRGAWAA